MSRLWAGHRPQCLTVFLSSFNSYIVETKYCTKVHTYPCTSQKNTNLTLACSLKPRESNPIYTHLYLHMQLYCLYFHPTSKPWPFDHILGSLSYLTMRYKLWDCYFPPPHAPTYSAGVTDEIPSIHMSSIQNDIDINNVIFYHSHELLRVTRRQG